ncbi:PspC domain-containing protein [Terrimonas pollutisoli]|uniref:PspC domain-containing protein n=1 Tax=Terrimonas pollutisoli TaxID=3034147 RepID=UPI0023EB8A56|nr:PspC domain-containing protein [Terrimonas sp. H1YJ31]
MKKIININLSGRVIPIEDSAYEKLQAYIESLRRYFSHEDGRDEIINDIESRIAELMNDKVRKGAACVTDTDINEIIASMGRPEDFDADTTDTGEAAQQAQQQQYSYSETRAKKRLYRDSSDKFIGGVCSGLAAYLNVDPAIVRILFAIITFGGFGLGFLAYILLWIVLPAKDIEHFGGKRLYRNPDDKMIGGVAGGLAAYFNIKSSTIRLIFLAPLALSIFISILDGLSWHNGFDFFPNIIFGSLSSTLFLIYIILWIVLPEANSPYEKMEMRGEKVDVNTIRQNVKEGMDSMKDRVKGWGEEVKESAQNLGTRAKEFANTRGRAFAAEVNETARRRGSGLGHAIGVLFKVFFLFIAGTIAFGLFVALMALLFGGIAWWPVNNFLWTSSSQQLYAWGTLIFFLGVPLIGFITWVIRRILRVRSRNSYLGWTFGGLWVLGWICVTLLASSLTKDVREYEHVDNAVSISQPPSGKMVVTVSEPELEYTGNFGWINDEGEGWDLSSDTLKLSFVKFDIVKSYDSLYYVTVKKYSSGRTEGEARNRAEQIQYDIVYRDSVLDIGNGFAIDKANKYRGQNVEIEIKMPVGKKIIFDESVEHKLNEVSFKRNRRRWSRNGWDYDYDDARRWRTGVVFTMGADGILTSAGSTRTDSSTPPAKDEYRYRYEDGNKTQPADDIQKQIDEEKRRREESEKRIKDLEKQKTEGQKSNTGNPESMDEHDEYTSISSASPVFSLVKSFF